MKSASVFNKKLLTRSLLVTLLLFEISLAFNSKYGPDFGDYEDPDKSNPKPEPKKYEPPTPNPEPPSP